MVIDNEVLCVCETCRYRYSCSLDMQEVMGYTYEDWYAADIDGYVED